MELTSLHLVPIPTLAAAVPLPVDFEIGKAQWAWARTLAKERMDAEAEQNEFKLWLTEKGERMNQSIFFVDVPISIS